MTSDVSRGVWQDRRPTSDLDRLAASVSPGRAGRASLPTHPYSAEDQAWSADVDHAIGASAGFDTRVAEVFRVQKKFGRLPEGAAQAQVDDRGLSEDQRVFIVL